MTNGDYYQYVRRLEQESKEKEWQRQLQNRAAYTDYASYDLNNFAPQGERVDNPTRLYAVLIVDSRVVDSEAVMPLYVRAKTREDARIRALLRSHYDEKDIKYLDLIALELVDVKPYAGDDEDEDDE